MKLMRLASACLAVAIAGCDAGSDVPADRLPRFVTPQGPPPRIALVLGSGGPRGFAHIGVLKALEEGGIKPDLIIGSSVGAMVGALYASGISATELEKQAYELNLLQFFEMSNITGGASSGRGVQSYVNEQVKHEPIEKLKIAFVASATHMPDRKQVLFNAGDTGLAVRASGASPGEFEAVRIGKDLYVDGDEASPVPIRAARRLGARVVIAVDVSAYAEDTPAGVPRDWVEKDERRAKQIAAEAPAADVMLHPNIGYYAGHDEKYRHRVIAAAERATREKMPSIHAALERAGISFAQNSPTARTPSGEASR
jgi:NTE family protein